MLTAEQQKLVEDYYGYALVIGFKSKGLDREQIMSDTRYNLCILARNYNPEKSSSFTGYLSVYLPLLNKDMLAKRLARGKFKIMENSLSLDKIYDDGSDLMDYTPQDTFIEPQELEDSIFINDVIELCTPKQKRAVELILAGYRKAEIARITNSTSQAVCDLFRNVKKKVLTNEIL